MRRKGSRGRESLPGGCESGWAGEQRRQSQGPGTAGSVAIERSAPGYSFISNRSCTLMNVGARVCDVSRTGIPWMSGPSTLLPVR